MSLTVQLRGVDEVLEFFEKRAKVPYFCIWDKTQPVSFYNGDDIEEAKEVLKDDLERFKKRNYSNPLVLSLYPDKSKAYKSTEPKYCSVSFVVDELILPSINSNDNNINVLLLSELRTMKSEIEALKVAKLQEETEQEEEEEEPEGMALISGVNQLLDHPVISGLIGKWLNGSAPVRNLAGIEEDKLNEYLKVLFSKGVTVAHIKKLSEMPEARLQMLISML